MESGTKLFAHPQLEIRVVSWFKYPGCNSFFLFKLSVNLDLITDIISVEVSGAGKYCNVPPLDCFRLL